MTAHYETCILLIEFDEDKFGLRVSDVPPLDSRCLLTSMQTKEDARREAAGRDTVDDWHDNFYLQSKLALLALTFPSLRIIWSSSPHESVRILSDLKLNHDEPDETTANAIGKAEGDKTARDAVQNVFAVEMLRAIPGLSGHNLNYVMSKVESLKELCEMSQKEVKGLLGDENGGKAWNFIHRDSRVERAHNEESRRRWMAVHGERSAQGQSAR